MAEYQWTEDTSPDRPGIWLHKSPNDFLTPVLVEDEENRVGTWCFLMDLPTIKDPPK